MTTSEKLADTIQKRIFELECSDHIPKRLERIIYLEDIRDGLKDGSYTLADAKEALAAGSDVLFNGCDTEDAGIHVGESGEGPSQRPAIDENVLAEFPIESLLPEYQDFAKAVASGTLTDNTTAGAAVLGGVSAIVGTRIMVRISASWSYHSGLYMMLLAPSSYGKSSVIEAVDQPVRTLEAQLRAETEIEVRRCRADVIHVEHEIKAKQTLLNSALKKGEPGSRIAEEIAQLEQDLRTLKAKSKPPVLTADDFTPEAVVDVLEQNDERVTVTSGDSGIFNLERYGENPSIELLLKCWKGEPHREVRRGRIEDADLQRPSMAMLVATQVENVKALAAKNPALVHRGLLPRFLPVLPEDKIGFRDIKAAILTGRGIPRDKQTRFNERLIDLARKLQAREGGVIELSLDEGALRAFVDYCQGYEVRMSPIGDLRPILVAAGKLPLQLQKLVGVNWAMKASLSDELATLVTKDIVDAAARQLRYFIAQQHRLYDALSQAPAEALADKLKRWCLYHPGTTVTSYELRKATARHVPKSLFEEALTMLVEEEIVTVRRVETGGRPSERVTVR